MLIGNWMSVHPTTIEVNQSVQQAINLMKERGIRHLPVTKNGKLIGMVSDQDMKRVSMSEATSLEIHELVYLLSKVEIGSIMSKEPIFITRECTLEEAAQIMLTHDIRGLPVVNEANEVLGVITQKDIFRVLVSLTGNGRRGILFALQLPDTFEAFLEVMELFHTFRCRLLSILTTDQKTPDGFVNAYIRIHGLEQAQLKDLYAGLKEKAQLLYVVDSRDGSREICRR